ncbi:MAG: DUF3078 domain-containing protein [Bacteroidales bacterium]|nr:DUF3078 domain-containing protein [Bacteroidales bacterium]MDE7338836.1 DUF3078 domain-containing protein [Bacteroidales bacterium]
MQIRLLKAVSVFVVGALCLPASHAFAEGEANQEEALAKASSWLIDFSGGINAAQAAMINWAAGGENSVAGNAYINFNSVYINGGHKWEAKLNTQYGLTWDPTNLLNKTVDNLYAATKYGYAIPGDHFYYTALVEFQTQYDRGYEKIDDRKKDRNNYISTIMAPGYLNVSAGMEYRLRDLLSVYFSPINCRTTFVLDDSLSAEGKFGVEKGKHYLFQPGMSLAGALSWTFYKNMTLKTDITLFTPYDKDFGNIVVDWNVRLEMAINEYFSAVIGTSLKYDDKVHVMKNGVDVGPKVQFREIVNIGIGYTFKYETPKAPAAE